MSIPAQPKALSSRDFTIAVVVLVAVATAAYHNSFGGPFVFDDVPAILDNPSLRGPWSLGELLHPAIGGGATVSGRPVVNLSFALNRMLGGEAVRGYHAGNFLIHLLAGLLLFGVARRTFRQPSLAGRYGGVALPLGLAVAGIWVLHPLQTESVTYIVQRAESLMGLWYLLTLYAFIRGAGAQAGSRWYIVSGTACLLGMATKEVMVSAPLMVLLYDRTFVAGTFRDAWRRRRTYYLGLASTWVLLGILRPAPRGGVAARASMPASPCGRMH